VTLTQPLRDEHAALVPHIDALASAADAVGLIGIVELRALIDASHAFLSDQLLPHADVEERALYPAVQQVLGAPEATATMSRDHGEVQALTEELDGLRRRIATADSLDDQLASALRRVLYGLHHLIKLHFAKEEEVYLPILDARLTDDDAAALFDAMHHAAGHDGHGR
jgi:hemerythrin-like domain-containing protein